MKIVKYKNIKFKKLKEIKNENVNKIYIEKGNKNIYKIFEKESKADLKLKEEKLKLFEEVNIDQILTPHTLIKKKNLLKGDITDYIKDNIPLADIIQFNPNIVKEILLEVSKVLEEIHNNKRKILIGDLHFYNIILDKYLNFYFIDIDSYGIGGIKPDNNSALIDFYFKEKNEVIKYNQNLDRLSFMLSLFNNITGKNVLNLNEKSYEVYTKKYEFLNDLRDLCIRLKESEEIIEVPYLHELIR